MLGLSWTEMLVIGLAALIFIGPKDLPVVMNRVGKIIGQIRRMGNEFQREINKTTGLDEVRNLRNAISEPLRKTSEEIRRDFNAMTPKGPQPSGLIKPTNPKVESVVDEIRAQAGMPATDTPVVEAPVPPAPAPLVAEAPAKKPAVKKAPVRAKAAPTRPVITTELPAVGAEVSEAAEAAPAKKPARKPAAKKAAAPKAATADAPKAPRKRAPAKPKAAPEVPADPETTAKAGSE
jgi:sec-independent protein translocase protein TatB